MTNRARHRDRESVNEIRGIKGGVPLGVWKGLFFTDGWCVVYIVKGCHSTKNQKNGPSQSPLWKFPPPVTCRIAGSVQIKEKKLGIRRMPSSWNLDFRQRFWASVKKLLFLIISVVIDGNIIFSNVYCLNYSIYACIHWVFFFFFFLVKICKWAMYFTQKAGLQL